MKEATKIQERKTNGVNGKHTKRALPRRLSSLSIKKQKHHLVVIFQGGSPVERMRAANELGDQFSMKVYRVDFRPCLSRFIGETEKNIDRIFQNIEPGQTILFFDEADSLFGKNPELPTGCDRSARWWIPHLNKKVKEFDGTVLFATNNHSRTTKISRQLKPVVTRLN